MRSSSRDASRKMHVGFLAGLIAVASMTSVAAPAAALAQNWGGPKGTPPAACDGTIYSECVTANNTHSVQYDSTLTTAWRDAMNSTLATYDTNSVMTITRNAPYGNTNDVRAATVNSASSYWGWTRCAATPNYAGSLAGTPPPYARGMNWCMPQLIYFNDRWASTIYPDLARKTAVACHEAGHTMGLRHRGTSPVGCLRTPPINTAPNPDVWWPSPTSEEYGHLNEFYN